MTAHTHTPLRAHAAHTNKQTNKQANKQTDRQANERTNKQAKQLTNAQAHHTHKHKHTMHKCTLRPRQRLRTERAQIAPSRHRVHPARAQCTEYAPVCWVGAGSWRNSHGRQTLQHTPKTHHNLSTQQPHHRSTASNTAQTQHPYTCE